ncbi:hypothetical protein AT00_01700 [Pseudoalteromonas lipolytica SCSIO 04301]|uniref:DUF4785 domain-containing protein n=1 Tax=Pseudoalteromonas lipolytica TaxID=570156 RepID=UPI000447E2C0|nr:DUF4785 domain-containing protein [Pseudoalteromonas lipolytica]EWH07823.1 hypothetical protein AT00_01700 [Pseudoalteromonas lipolytica SCSIO 04301]
MINNLSKICAAILLVSSAANANEQTVYQFPEVQSASVAQLHMLEKDSVEYWQRVSGKELKRGVPVFVNQAEHFIRIAPKARFESGEVFKPRDLQLDKFSVSDANAQQLPMHAIAAREQMQNAGFTDGSVGLKLGQVNAKAMLKTSQALNDNDTYLVHVIEKGSRNALHAKTQFKVNDQQQRVGMQLSMGQKRVKDNEVQLSLYSPEGEQLDVRYENGEAVFTYPLETLGAANGYYELEANVETKVNGQTVKRSIKMPFVNSSQTITMDNAKVTALGNNQYQAWVPVQVTDSGRYAIRATLTGKGDKGERVKLATVEVAKQIDNYDQFMMPFSVSKAAKAPFELVDIELTDQTRMLKFAQGQ